MKRRLTITLCLLLSLLTAAGQSAADKKIAEQKKAIAALEKRIADEEKELSKLRKGRSATEERVKRLARQIDSRNQLLETAERQADLLVAEIRRADSTARGLNGDLTREKERYADMVREAYRNYRHNNFLTYLFASKSFRDATRRIADLRNVAAMRRAKVLRIDSLSAQVSEQQRELDLRRRSLDSVRGKLSSQRAQLERDARTARADLQRMSKKEQGVLRDKIAREQQLSVAIDELRKLTKGNKEGVSFSAKTSGLHLPVIGGAVRRYKGNMAEITGPRGARVVSIYDGKVVDVKRNRITNKYDVYVAHGEYLTSYANLGSVCVEKGAKVAKNEALGTIGSTVDITTMKTEYKMVFGVYSPSPNETMLAEKCFKK